MFRQTTISHTVTVEDEPELPVNDPPAGDNDCPADNNDLPAGLSDSGQAFDESNNLVDVDNIFFGPGDRLYCNYHPKLNGHFLEDGAPPAPPPDKSPNDWILYQDQVEFDTAEFLTINNTPLGDVKWQSFKVRYTGEKPTSDVPPWMDQSHDVWYCDPHEVIQNMLGNPDYEKEMDYRPFREYSADGNKRQWQDFMSGDWAWNQADIICEDPDTLSSTFMPVILGSDKTTVSVATGANDYYPLYVLIGNVCNNVQRAHCDTITIVGFLAMPKIEKLQRSTLPMHVILPIAQNASMHALSLIYLQNLVSPISTPSSTNSYLSKRTQMTSTLPLTSRLQDVLNLMEKLEVFNSASSMFYVPSDRSGIGGMRWEHICACPVWRNEAPRYDCVFINTDAGVEGMGGMEVARIMCFFHSRLKVFCTHAL
ncbi:hypothetical protein EDB19DRAFT_1833778 [Suillus lakei]|nr:hypothetical protein EDB19DRAFT_1833778 [Suillus lakei]